MNMIAVSRVSYNFFFIGEEGEGSSYIFPIILPTLSAY